MSSPKEGGDSRPSAGPPVFHEESSGIAGSLLGRSRRREPPPRALGSPAAPVDRPLGSRPEPARRHPRPTMTLPPAPTAPTRVALVGAGFIADFHLEILAETPGVEVVAVCDADLGRAEDLARRFGVPRALASSDELQAEE